MAKLKNARHELFCQLYAGDEEFFCNGTRAYAQAYDVDLDKEYNTAKVNASKLLTKTNILDRINEIIDDAGLNDAFVDKQLKKLITQDADFSNKMSAIREYNKLRARIEERKRLEIVDASKVREELEKERDVL